MTRFHKPALTAILCATVLLPSVLRAAATVTAEYGEIRDGRWAFPTIAGPSRSDLAQKATLRIVGNTLHPKGQDAAGLNDGTVSTDGADPLQAVVFTDANADNGTILMDLGAAQPIRQINTYSYHVWNVDQGSRTPQVYTLYGTAEAAAPPADNPAATRQWVKIADVDSRPNKTGAGWGGRIHGVQIADAAGKDLGVFRFLLWDVQPTRSPLQKEHKWTPTFFTEFDVHSAETLAQSRAARLFKTHAALEQVVIAFKTHFDIGYTALAREVVQRYRTGMIEQALQVVDKNKNLPPEQQFVWTIPGWPMSKILDDWDGQKPERKQRVLDALKEGRFAVHALPFTTHTETLELEDLVRGMNFASKISRAAGRNLPHDAKMTDVSSHCWIVPTLLKNAGVEFLHIGCNPACTSPKVPSLFLWEGPDGSRLLTMYTSDGYGTGLLPPKGWPYKTWLALTHTGDNHGPPTPEEVKKLLNEAAQKLPGVKVRIGRLSDFADAILAEKPDLPVVRGDMPDTWIHGLMCDPEGASIARNTRPRLAATEALQTQLRLWGAPVPDAAPALALAYENSLLYGEHTWGGAQYWITQYGKGKTKFGYGDVWKAEREAGRFKRLEESWDEHTGYIVKAHDTIAPILDGGLRALAQAVNIEGQRIVVFNPLPWKRDGIAVLAANKASFTALKPADGADATQVQTKDGTLRFLARDIPPMGCRTFVPVKAEASPLSFKGDEAAATIESPTFKAVLDPARCCVKSLVEKKTGRELVDANAEYGFGQYLYERFDVDNTKAFLKAYVKIQADWANNEIGKPNMPPKDQAPYAASSPAGGMLKLEQGGCSISAVMSAPAGGGVRNAITAKLTLYDQLPYADFEITLLDKPADPWPEAGWLCFPFRADEPQFRLGRLGAIVDPAKDCMEGCNNECFWLNSGMAALDGKGAGAGLCPLDHPLVSLGQPGLWRYTREFTPRKPIVFVNLFNNQWTTNFRMWNGGTWTSRVRVWAIDKYAASESLATPCLEARSSMLAAYGEGPAGKLPATQSGLELSRKGVAVTAFGPNPDGTGTVLRLWEQAGTAGACEVRLPAGMDAKTVQPVDLRGRPAGQPLPVKDRAFTVPLRAFAPTSFVIDTL